MVGPVDQAQTFSRFYASTTDPSEIVKPLKRFFQDVWVAYQNQEPLSDGTLIDAYNRLWQSAHTGSIPFDEQTLEDWQKYLPAKQFCQYAKQELPEPRNWLARRHKTIRFPHLRQCVVHGDLHGDNLLVDGHGTTSFVWL